MLAAQEYAAEQQQRFIDDASHELRTPMTVLTAEIDLALRRPRSAAEYEETLRRIAEDANRLVELADELLTLGAQGTRTLQARDFAVVDLLDSASKRARGMLPDAGERHVCALDPGRLMAHGDPALLQRALGNLVDNAVRYGDGTITLSARAMSERSPAAVLLAVHDEGPGVPAEFLAHAAERFRQAQESRTGRGNGLGLSLVDAIATAHHGQLRFCSNGSHHRRPTSNAGLDARLCDHLLQGTTSSLLLPGPTPHN
jgi:signal transduction histidine kinase